MLIPFGVVWAGYLLGWYGYTMLQGPGIGIADLVIPSRVPKLNALLAAGTSIGPGGLPPGTQVVPPNTPTAPGGNFVVPKGGNLPGNVG